MTDTRNMLTTEEIAARFTELARQERWFDIQEELFSDQIKSIEPPGSPYLPNVQGKNAVRRKGEEWVERIEQVHHTHTTATVSGGKYFAVGREMDITVKDLGRIQIRQIMLYEVSEGMIITEQFFY